MESVTLELDPPIPELQVTRKQQLNGEEIEFTFNQPEGFEVDQYPIETSLRCFATFKDYTEARFIERRLVILPSTDSPPPPPPKPLKDDPETIKIVSRQPVKIVIGGPDVHVKLKWDGKDHLVKGDPALWTINPSCEFSSVEPQFSLTDPVEGRFELLIQATEGLKAGEQLKFIIEATGPGKTISVDFLADVVEAPSPKKSLIQMPSGAQRRPPYELKYIKKNQWESPTCWGETWSGADAGSFDEPSAQAPLGLIFCLLVLKENALLKLKAQQLLKIELLVSLIL